MGRSQYKKFCLSNVSFAKCIFTFTKFISLAHATMLGKFKNLIRISRTNVIDKIKGYRIYALVNPFTGRNQFITLNYVSDIWCILSSFRQNRTHPVTLFVFLFSFFYLRLGYRGGHG